MRTFSHMSLRGFNEKLNSSSIHPVHRNNGMKASFVAIIQIAGDYRQEWKENMDMRMDNCFEGLARSSSSLIPFPSFTSTQRMRQRVSKHRRPLSPQPWTVKWLFEQFHSCLLWTSPCTLSIEGLFIHPEGESIVAVSSSCRIAKVQQESNLCGCRKVNTLHCAPA